MPSPRHHIVDIEPPESVGEASPRLTTDSTVAENLQDRVTIVVHEQDPKGGELVVENNAKPTQDGGRPRLAPEFFIGTPDDIPKGDTDVRQNSTMDDARFRQLGFSGGFLENCSQCKVKLPENADLYMYGYDPGAYCSVDCRRKRMALDGYHIEVATPPDGRDRIEDKQSSWCHLL